MIIDAIKLAEDGSGLVFRLYEANGKAETTAAGILPQTGAGGADRPAGKRDRAADPATDDRLELSFRPFEIKTIKVSFD